MTSPYDIEEIFPDDAAGPVRLPRRQSGNSPQGLAVTLLADYTLRTRAWLPSAAIVALLAEAGVTSAGARTAISRLSRRGVLEGSKRGRNSSYRLSRSAAAVLSAGGRAIASSDAGAGTWDEHWTLIAFSLPQDEVARRRELRSRLRWLGYAPLYDGLWISPHDLTEQAKKHLVELTFGAVTVFRARHVDLDAVIHRNPLDAWDTAAVAEQYEVFIGRWSPLLDRVRGTGVTGADAVRARTEVMDTYRRLPYLDPRLPARLLPADWLREPARDLFAAVYDGLAAPAEDYVRAVAGRFTTEPLDDIRAHTIADLVTGLQESHSPSRTGGAP
ncbi:PaaX family transcriptional regulator C-terminal domain-containing protein [Saccharothrix longispora]|uniref:Phenylacetic acid degradation operon negative regulatory protein n=1 Tax=Saccharothrix longispora TaxID=33920 RepID=A0ABU1PTX9_9PSEU|nr:PaaX family transcriptional regulator C-terminal domain-containing protein [Saccharothrix longispora]MDR6594105.1 phenylacetic acid degradation operon negative regulatory protein [Saccharothrix longispora]